MGDSRIKKPCHKCGSLDLDVVYGGRNIRCNSCHRDFGPFLINPDEDIAIEMWNDKDLIYQKLPESDDIRRGKILNIDKEKNLIIIQWDDGIIEDVKPNDSLSKNRKEFKK